MAPSSKSAAAARLAPIACLLFLVLTPAAKAGDDGAPPETVQVGRRSLTVTVDTAGTLVPRAALEVAYEPEVYGGALEVVTAADTGPVVVGQELVRFDDEDVRRDIGDRERDLYIARARLEKQEADLRDKHSDMEMQRAQLTTRLERTEQELRLFLEVHKPTRIAQSEFGLQGTEDRIQEQVEELEQLERMYEADDLTEETEEIVIRRARRSLARQRQSFEWQKQRHQLFLEVTLPQEEEDLQVNLERRRQELAAFEAASQPEMRRVELELEKARVAFERQEKALRDLRADRDALRVRAPSDGYAVPGAFVGTKWQDLDGMRRALAPGGRLKAGQTLFTIVQPGNVGVAAAIDEDELLRVKAGQAVVVRPAVAADTTLDGEVAEVLAVATGGKHDVRIDLKSTKPFLMPGQSCKVEIVIRRVDDALAVPADAVKKDGDRRLVYVWEDGEAREREVVLGARSGRWWEILEGLTEGARILAKPPEPAK